MTLYAAIHVILNMTSHAIHVILNMTSHAIHVILNMTSHAIHVILNECKAFWEQRVGKNVSRR